MTEQLRTAGLRRRVVAARRAGCALRHEAAS